MTRKFCKRNAILGPLVFAGSMMCVFTGYSLQSAVIFHLATVGALLGFIAFWLLGLFPILINNLYRTDRDGHYGKQIDKGVLLFFLFEEEQSDLERNLKTTAKYRR